MATPIEYNMVTKIASHNADGKSLKIYKEYSFARATNGIKLFVSDAIDAPAGHSFLIEPHGVDATLAFLTSDEKELYLKFGKQVVLLTKIPKTKLVFRFNFANEAYRFELTAGSVNSFYDMLKAFKPYDSPQNPCDEIELDEDEWKNQ